MREIADLESKKRVVRRHITHLTQISSKCQLQMSQKNARRQATGGGKTSHTNQHPMSAAGSDETQTLGEAEPLLSRPKKKPSITDEDKRDGRWGNVGAIASATLLIVIFVIESALYDPTPRGTVLNLQEGVPLLGLPGDTVSLPSVYTPEAQADKIASLPGLNKDPGFNMFSGYLTVSEEKGRNIFYWYVESQNDPTKDPVVFWTNGGPGCSGLIGFGQEHGPFHFNKDGVATANPYSWNKVANMLYVEQPAGVGYSYSDTPGDLENVSDDDAAVDNLVAIQKFFERFPERLDNDFYISSESYGGHYVPQLAKKILERIGTAGYKISFRGFLVGNPWVDPFTNDVAQSRSFYQHGLISRPMLDDWLSKCSDRATYDHKACPKAIRGMRKNMKSISPYALDYPVCNEEKIDLNDSASSQVMHFLNQTARKDQYPRVRPQPRFLPPDVKYLPCAEQHFKVYLNQVVVQEALHVRRMPQRWRACASDKDLSYSNHDFLESQIDLYKELIDVAKQGHLHLNMMVYSGDNDSVCSTTSTEAWIYDLGVSPTPEQDWNQWSFNDQTAGFITNFDLGEKTQSKFIFATIHGAGHEAPAYRPIESLELFKNFIQDEL